MTAENRVTVRVIGLEESASGQSLRAEMLHWNVAPENMPYALHVGIQPELVPAGKIIRCQATDIWSVEHGMVTTAVRRGDEWVIETSSRRLF